MLTAIVLGLVWARPLSRATLPPRVSLAPFQLMADGYDSATLTIDEPSPSAPVISIEPPHAATVHDVSRYRSRLAGADSRGRDSGHRRGAGGRFRDGRRR